MFTWATAVYEWLLTWATAVYIWMLTWVMYGCWPGLLQFVCGCWCWLLQFMCGCWLRQLHFMDGCWLGLLQFMYGCCCVDSGQHMSSVSAENGWPENNMQEHAVCRCQRTGMLTWQVMRHWNYPLFCESPLYQHLSGNAFKLTQVHQIMFNGTPSDGWLHEIPPLLLFDDHFFFFTFPVYFNPFIPTIP